MPRNKIGDLQNHLFEQIERLKDDELDLEKEIRRARAIQGLGQTLINSAKEENVFLKMTGGKGSGFIQANPKQIEGS